MDSRVDALIIGCGVTGLSTAVRVQEAGLGVHVWSVALPNRTTSSVAAAIWYPYKAYPEDRVLSWGKRTYEVFEELAQDPKTGVRMREVVPDPWWKDAVPGVRRCTEGELPHDYRDGHAFVVPVIEMPIYLDYLLQRFIEKGGHFEQRAVSSLEEAFGEGHVIVNCTGLGARELAGDLSMTPIRGQILRVVNPGLERFVLDEGNPEGITYIVPRSEDCVLGGTAEVGNWGTTPDPETAMGILRRCAALETRLAEAEILEHRVGLRPGRPEVRLELDRLANGAPCVHNYGHGGSGVTLSWGCAEEAQKLVQRTLVR